MEQREYNVVQDLYHSGIKRTVKKTVGRARKKTAKVLDNYMDRNIEKNNHALIEFFHKKDSLKKDPSEVKRALDKYKDKLNYEVTQERLYPNGAANINKEGIKLAKEVGVNLDPYLKGKENLVIAPEGTFLGEALHEVGHLENSQSRGLRGVINRAATTGSANLDVQSRAATGYSPLGNKRVRFESGTNQDVENALGQTGIVTSVKNAFTGVARRVEESNASRFAKKKLKASNNIDKKRQKQEVELLNIGGKAYTPLLKNSVVLPIRNKVQIPSRRGDFGGHVYKNMK